MAKKQVAKVLVKKKRWVPIIAPKLFNEHEIGEMHVEEPRNAVGRKFAVSMTTVTGDPKAQNILVKFLITGVVGDSLQTELIGYRMNTAATKRMMRRNRSKIDDSIAYKTEDEKKIRIKPMIITRGRAQGGVKTAIRNLVRDYLEKTVTKMKYEQLMREIIQGKFQRTIQDMLKKTYPIAISDIRQIELVMPKKQA